MIKLTMLPVLFSAGSTVAFAQGLNNWWLTGYYSYTEPLFGGAVVQFSDLDEPSVGSHPREMNFSTTAANISDANGVLQFYTNGVYIADENDSPMPNGEGLNPSFYTTSQEFYGLSGSQLNFTLCAFSNGLLPLIHSTPDSYNSMGLLVTESIYRTTIEMSLNYGYGDVLVKNEVLFNEDLEPGGLASIRHANGRDWWVITHGSASDEFVSFLITPDSVLGPYHQQIGVQRGGYGPMGIFSPDGTRFAYVDGYYGLDLFSFDRCTGSLSDHLHIPLAGSVGSRGNAFSPNGNVLYVTEGEKVYQYDLTAPNIAASRITVAEWDGFYDTHPVFSTLFWIARLAPDGKIYISTSNGTRYLHVIHQPDVLGIGCDLEQRGVTLPTYNANSIPYHPNYWLGPVDGSPCDTLGLNTTVAANSLEGGLNVSIHPNPSTGTFTLGYPAQAVSGELEVLDMAGRVLHRQRLAPWSTQQRLELPGCSAGMYHCRLRWQDRTATTRLVIHSD